MLKCLAELVRMLSLFMNPIKKGGILDEVRCKDVTDQILISVTLV